jgi:hypothetical protein
MTDWAPQSEHLLELANLPANAMDRQVMQTQVRLSSGVERDYWLSYLAETDRLYEELARVQPPQGLQDRLLRLPGGAQAPLPWHRRPITLDWKAVAAILVLGVGLLSYLYFNSGPRRPVMPEPLAEAMAGPIATQAVEFHQFNPALEVVSNDPTKVQTELSGHQFSFPVMVLQPYSPKISLLGGGTCDLDGTQAVYTRYSDSKFTYTVFEFDGSRVGVPANFQRTVESPPGVPQNSQHYRVVIWPGPAGKCTWALVLESDAASDQFSQATY